MTTDPLDLKITGAVLPRRDGVWDIAIAQTRIVDIAPAIATPAHQTLDAHDYLLIPGLVDAHFHLDKALILNRAPAVEGTFQEAMRETMRLKQSFTVADIQTRARRAIENAIALGVTTMRSHVEVDSVAELRAMQALLPLRQEYAWGMTLQLAVFAQEGITHSADEEPLLRQAMAMGGDVIGSAPYVDSEPERNVQIVFDIAQDFNCDVDFHLDFLDDNSPLLLPFVIQETIKRGWQGRVCLGHMTKLAGLTPDQLAALAPSICAAGISILALPASDIYIMARKDTHNQRRGVAPVHQLAELGVNVGVAVNNVQNLFTPFGDGDVLKICTLLAEILQMGTTTSHLLCLEMATTQAAKAIGIHNHAVAVGNLANLVLLKTASVTEAIATAPVERTVIKNGRIVAQTKLERQLMCG
ncbi:MAG: amidohydrolase family protein [Oculatellaceae cyanobacterium bins.114]|nr:amidohydrolase family protein [Oculatellaceae cyanobacterium bins.114]